MIFDGAKNKIKIKICACTVKKIKIGLYHKYDKKLTCDSIFQKAIAWHSETYLWSSAEQFSYSK
jgi:hypothetical protein